MADEMKPWGPRYLSGTDILRLDAVDKVTGRVQQASSSVNDEVVKTALQVVTLVQGIRTIRDAFKKK